VELERMPISPFSLLLPLHPTVRVNLLNVLSMELFRATLRITRRSGRLLERLRELGSISLGMLTTSLIPLPFTCVLQFSLVSVEHLADSQLCE